MWKLFVLLAAVAAYRLWGMDHGVLAGLAALAGVLAFWSAGVMDNYARASRNYLGAPTSVIETIAITVNLLASLASVVMLVLSAFV